MENIKVYSENGKTVIEVPEGASVEVRNLKPEFKKGDFIVTEHGDKLIISETGIYQGLTKYIKCFDLNECRLMTDAEKEEFIEALHKKGIDWDGNNIVDWKWKPKIGEEYWTIAPYARGGIDKSPNIGSITDGYVIDNNLAFRTKEEAEAALERARE